jgi:hypothetical protein
VQLKRSRAFVLIPLGAWRFERCTQWRLALPTTVNPSAFELGLTRSLRLKRRARKSFLLLLLALMMRHILASRGWQENGSLTLLNRAKSMALSNRLAALCAGRRCFGNTSASSLMEVTTTKSFPKLAQRALYRWWRHDDENLPRGRWINSCSCIFDCALIGDSLCT